jgi:hypothetical protein|tara:strand:+ start:1094 stop:1291 length:198 start_codon:yes stop_codon:yes gene_type:complete
MPVVGFRNYPDTTKGQKAYDDFVQSFTGKPTGQGYGAARKGPSVVGPEKDVVVDYSSESPKEYKD